MTYPLDTLRLRLAVDPAARSLRGAALALLREGSYPAFFRGLGASMLGARFQKAYNLFPFTLVSVRIVVLVLLREGSYLAFLRGVTDSMLGASALNWGVPYAGCLEQWLYGG